MRKKRREDAVFHRSMELQGDDKSPTILDMYEEDKLVIVAILASASLDLREASEVITAGKGRFRTDSPIICDFSRGATLINALVPYNT